MGDPSHTWRLSLYFRTDGRVFLHPSSVNHEERKFASQWLTYHEKVNQSVKRVQFTRSSSVIKRFCCCIESTRPVTAAIGFFLPSVAFILQKKINKNVIQRPRSVRVGRKCAPGFEYSRPRAQFPPIRTSRPVNNMYICSLRQPNFLNFPGEHAPVTHRRLEPLVLAWSVSSLDRTLRRTEENVWNGNVWKPNKKPNWIRFEIRITPELFCFVFSRRKPHFSFVNVWSAINEFTG